MRRPFSRTFSAALKTVEPQIVAVRAAPVPEPQVWTLVSPSTTRMAEASSPRVSETIWV